MVMTSTHRTDDRLAWLPRRAAGAARLVIWLGAGAFAVTFAANGHAQNADRQLRRPAAHSFLGSHSSSTTSFAQRTVALPAAGQVEFEYFVDSELNHDFFRVLVDSTQAFEASGRNRAGRVTLPLTAGSHTLRFSYTKDAQGDVGQDVAFIDRLRVTGGSLFETNNFDEPLLQTPTGYTAGGTGGGWAVAEHAARRGIRRSHEGAFKSYSPNGIRSSVQRQITWPAGSTQNDLLVLYAVDSELNHDFFKVYVDGTEKFSVSGLNQSGSARIDVGSAGAHTIRLEYVKDESVDEGLDDASVLQLEAHSNGVAFELGGFDGQKTGAAPEGWQVSPGADEGWVIGPALSPRVYTFPEVPAALPSIDGLREADYKLGSRTKLRDSDNSTGARGKVELLFTANQPSLFLLLRAQGRTSELGSEEGDFTLLFDAKHRATLSGGGCASDVLLPGDEDRRLRISYESDVGTGAATVSVGQDKGTCNASTPWQAVSGSEAWPVEAAVLEPDKDLGFVLLELTIGLDAAPSVATDGSFGLGFAMNSAATLSYRLPGHDGLPLLENDVSTWENVILQTLTLTQRPPSHVLIDGTQRPTDEE